MCLPSDALLQHLPFYLGFSYLGRGVSLQGCSRKAQPLLLTLDEGYLLIAAPADLERGVAPLSRPFCIRAAAASMIKEMQIKITVLLYSYHLAKLESWIISSDVDTMKQLLSHTLVAEG